LDEVRFNNVKFFDEGIHRAEDDIKQGIDYSLTRDPAG
jgi:hypothetical protein